MDNISHLNHIPKELLEESSLACEEYLDCLTDLQAHSKNDKFTQYIINEWKNDFNKELE